MKLDNIGIKDSKAWEKAGYRLPAYDRGEMIRHTMEEPVWVHFGAGNIFRAFQARIADDMLGAGLMKSGITVVEGYDPEIIEKAYRSCDNYSILVTLKSDGNVEKRVIGAVGEARILDYEDEAEAIRLKEIFAAPSLSMCTFTITEKGYCLTDNRGELLKSVASDLEKGPEKPVSYMGGVAALLYARFLNGGLPIAMVSTDNCSHNGDKLKSAVLLFAEGWEKNGVCEKGFSDYILSSRVSFPWSMIDKITPRPDAEVERLLVADGLVGLEPVITCKNTYVSPFVNAEETEYLVIEDDFPAGRPELSRAGVIFTDRDTVDKVEKMKVCTCLNPLHTALAVYGCILGYKIISEEMKDPELVGLIKAVGYSEGLPVVTDPKVLNPREFIDTVVNVRLTNPFMPDSPQRIATDTSKKLSIRFGETVKKYIDEGRDITTLKMIPLVYAGWLRYLMAVDDEGRPFELSPDPCLEVLKSVFSFGLGYSDEHYDEVKAVLSDVSIFGIDLEQCGLADTVMNYFLELSKGVGAVRKTLVKYISTGDTSI